MDVANALKNFLYDRTIYAFAALELLAIVWLVRKLLRTKDEQLAMKDDQIRMAMQLAPLAESLVTLLKSSGKRRERHDLSIAALPPQSSGNGS